MGKIKKKNKTKNTIQTNKRISRNFENLTDMMAWKNLYKKIADQKEVLDWRHCFYPEDES